MKLSERMFAVSLLLVLGPVACPSQNFSADVVFVDAKANAGSLNSDSSAHKASRLFVSEDKMRLDMFGPDGIILLVDTADQTAFALFPAKREYAPLAAPFPNISELRILKTHALIGRRFRLRKLIARKSGMRL